MKCLYFDCFSGISGDMTLAALIDLGVPQKYLKEELKKLAVSGYTVRVSRTMRMGISGKRILVKTGADKSLHHNRSYKDIEAVIKRSTLKSHIKDRSLDIFYRIANAEAHIHGKKVSEIHFHEVGATDSIVDIVGSVIGIDYLRAEHFYSSSVPLGHGLIQCQHGTLPVPTPATLLLLKGAPVYESGIRSELVTPTGAAILTSLVRDFGHMPSMTILKTGYGAGTRELENMPNMLRLILGEMEGAIGSDYVRVLEANIDDMNPEWTGYLMERLFEEGALDVSIIPVYMKKNRPGILIQVICSEQNRQILTRMIFQESTTAGVRSYRAERSVLKRRVGKLKTKFGTLRVKIFDDGNGEQVVPEFEECRRVAIKKKIPLKDVYKEVILSARRKNQI
jgi:hypothetical protein